MSRKNMALVFKKIIIIITILIITSCKSISYTNNYLLYSFENINKEYKYTFEFYSKNSGVHKDILYSKYDISYSKINDNRIYLYGMGGLYEVDVDLFKVVALITNMDISSVAFDFEYIYFIENVGILQNSKEYVSNLYKYNKKTGIKTIVCSVNYPVGSIEVYNNIIYIYKLSLSEDERVFVDSFTKTGDYIKNYNLKKWGILKIINDKLFIQSDKELYDFISDLTIDIECDLYSPYQYIAFSDGLILSFDYDGLTCTFRKNKEIQKTFKNCSGYYPMNNFEFIVIDNNGMYIYNTEENKVYKEKIEKKDFFRYYIIPY